MAHNSSEIRPTVRYYLFYFSFGALDRPVHDKSSRNPYASRTTKSSPSVKKVLSSYLSKIGIVTKCMLHFAHLQLAPQKPG